MLKGKKNSYAGANVWNTILKNNVKCKWINICMDKVNVKITHEKLNKTEYGKVSLYGSAKIRIMKIPKGGD